MTTPSKRSGSGYWKATTLALDGKHLVVELDGGRTVRVSLSALGISARPRIASMRVIGFGSGFEIVRADGSRQDVALDFIRYHVDPQYRAKQQAQVGTLAERIGAQIRLLRLARGQTAAKTAQRLGMARQNYSRIETGKHLPSIEILLRIADVLGGSLDSLTGRHHDRSADAA